MSMANLVKELTVVALLVAIVLIPLGLQTLATANTTGLSPAAVTAISAIGVIIVAAIIIAVMDGALKGKK
jgi:FtsH-binding integral membrane protein